MNFSLKSFVFLCVAVLFSACSSSNESDKPYKETEISAAEKLQIEAWNDLSPMAQKILGSYKGIIRDKSWGQQIETIQESLEKSENQPDNGVSFTNYLDDSDLNFVDISYTGKEGRLNAIKFDVFLEEKAEVSSLKTELVTFLNKKFSKPKDINALKTSWSYEKTQIVLEDVSTSKDPGLQLIFTEKP